MERAEGNNSPEQLIDPVKLARRAFNQELFNPEYRGHEVLSKLIELKDALVNSTLEGQMVYLELSIVAKQGVQRAKMNNDDFTMLILRELKNGYELAYEHSNPMQDKHPIQNKQDLVKKYEKREISTLPLKCGKETCKYEWQYTGKKPYATCPNCRHTVKTGLQKNKIG